MNSVMEDSGTALLTEFVVDLGPELLASRVGASIRNHASENSENVVCAGLHVSLQVQCRRGGVPRRCVSNHVLRKIYADCMLPKTDVSRKVHLRVSSVPAHLRLDPRLDPRLEFGRSKKHYWVSFDVSRDYIY